MDTATLLILSADPDLRAEVLALRLDEAEPVFYEDAAEALAASRKLDVALFVVDAREGAPLAEGFCRRIQALPSEPELLLLVSAGAPIVAELPPENIHVRGAVPGALKEQIRRLLRLWLVRRTSGIVGQSASIRELLATIAQVAPLDVPVLIQGESGTGKEMVARALHRGSIRSERPFVSINVGSVAETLLESELFGHEKGAFTGAVERREGVFERAEGGTLFLDEVGEMSPAMQVKLLRVLESGEFQRVGGNRTLRTDLRLLAATHRDLEREIEAGRFRSDLYYRLKVVKILIHPLRERREDIPPLVHHFLEEANRRHDLQRKGLTREAMERFLRYAWPGNARELKNIVFSMAVLGAGEFLGIEDLPPEFAENAARPGALPVAYGSVREEGRPDPLVSSTLLRLANDIQEILRRLERLENRLGGPKAPPPPPGWELSAGEAEFTPVGGGEGSPDLAAAEKALIQMTLRQTGGNRRRTAERLGISERTLYRKLKSYGLH